MIESHNDNDAAHATTGDAEQATRPGYFGSPVRVANVTRVERAQINFDTLGTSRNFRQK